MDTLLALDLLADLPDAMVSTSPRLQACHNLGAQLAAEHKVTGQLNALAVELEALGGKLHALFILLNSSLVKVSHHGCVGVVDGQLEVDGFQNLCLPSHQLLPCEGKVPKFHNLVDGNAIFF